MNGLINSHRAELWVAGVWIVWEFADKSIY